MSVRNRKKKEEKKVQPLDLGLGAILADVSTPTVEVTSVVSVTKAAHSVEEKIPVPIHQIEQSYKQAEYRLATQLSDTLLKEAPSLLARLWWARSHLRAGGVPLGLVVAGVLQAFRESTERSHADERVSDLLISELRESLLKTKNDVLLSELEQSYDRWLSQDFYKPEPQSAQIQKSTSKEGACSTQVLASFVAMLEERRIQGLSQNLSSKLSPVARLREGLRSNVSLKYVGVGALCVLALILSGAFRAAPPAQYAFAPPHTMRSGTISDLNSALDLQLPILPEQVEINALAAIAIDFESSTPGLAAPTTPSTVAAVAPINKPPAAVRVSAPTQKDTVDLSGPYEPAEIRDAAQEPENIEEEIFEIDFPPFRKSRTARQSTRGSQSDVSVQRFTPPRKFTVIAPTRVMESPSYWARALGAFDIGDETAVEAQVGVWMRIRMKNGKAGYILAQDVSDE